MAPTLANPHDSLGEILTWAGKYEEAKTEFLTAVQLQPDFFVSLMNLGNIYMLQGQLTKGSEILDQVYAEVDIEFRRQNIYEIKIRNYYLHNMFEMTMQTIKERNEAFPDDKFMNAIYDVLSGNEARGKSSFADFLEEQYARPEISNPIINEAVQIADYNFRSILARHTGNLDEAIGYMEKILKLREDNPPHEWVQYRCRLADILYEAGRYSDCATQCFTVLEHYTGRISPLLLLARSAHQLGKDEIARTAMEKLKPLIDVADEEIPAKAVYRDLAEKMALPL
jgi:tetratricopeptide (TPR) repeat protein